jgi:hypothetical protein
MDRNKVLELAREADLYMTSDERIAAVERFAALVEREVRGDAASGDIHSCSYYCTRPACIKAQRDELRDRMESATVLDADPVAWMSPKKERLEFSRADTVYGSHTIPLYTHPTPAVVRQLVEALEDSEHYIVLDLARHDEAYDRHPFGEQERSQIVQDLEKLRAALDAAKGNSNG